MESLDVKKLYHDLHQIPELGEQEFKTSTYVADILEKLGYEVTRNIGGTTGVVAIEKGTIPGPTLLLRADMDALPFVIDGKPCCIHACGHDGHMSMLLAAASVLKGKIKRGTLKLLFQPAEETFVGAVSMIKTGVLEGVDMALGLHIRPKQDIPYGTIAPGVQHSASTFAEVTIKGVGCHASRPHLGVNTLEVAAAVINAIATIKMNPNLSCSYKPTIIKSNSNATNVIPSETIITYDIRSESNELMDELVKKFKLAAVNTAKAYGAEANVNFPSGIIPAARLDEELTRDVAESVKRVLGEDKLMPLLKNPGGEDFHFYAYKYPNLKAAYFGVGVAADPGLHAPNMSFNIDALQNGVDVLVDVTLHKLG